MGILTSNTDDEQLGAEAIVDAIYSNFGLEAVDECVLGEPLLKGVDDAAVSEPFIEVPTHANPESVDPSSLYFALPDGPDVENDFTRFLNAIGIQNVADLDQLEGEIVPLAWENGTPVPDLEEVMGIEQDT